MGKRGVIIGNSSYEVVEWCKGCFDRVEAKGGTQSLCDRNYHWKSHQGFAKLYKYAKGWLLKGNENRVGYDLRERHSNCLVSTYFLSVSGTDC